MEFLSFVFKYWVEFSSSIRGLSLRVEFDRRVCMFCLWVKVLEWAFQVEFLS